MSRENITITSRGTALTRKEESVVACKAKTNCLAFAFCHLSIEALEHVAIATGDQSIRFLNGALRSGDALRPLAGLVADAAAD
jgi:hypothetical protein